MIEYPDCFVRREGMGPLKPLQSASLQVKTDLHALNPVVLPWFLQFKRAPLSNEDWLKCQLCVAEGFTNAVRHAHRGKPEDWPIDLDVVMLPDHIEIRIWDLGAPFDMTAKLRVLPDTLNTEAEGGRGLKLMERVSDVLTYTRSADGRNCLFILKRYSATGKSL